MPERHNQLVSLDNYYGQDDPKLWDEIKAEGARRDPRRRPLQHLRAGGGHARDHARDQIRRADRRAAHGHVRARGALDDAGAAACRMRAACSCRSR